jgi:hypothetical protein
MSRGLIPPEQHVLWINPTRIGVSWGSQIPATSQPCNRDLMDHHDSVCNIYNLGQISNVVC